MAVFTYVARDQTGRVVRGRIEAENERVVQRRLREMGYIPTEVKRERAAKAAMAKPINIPLLGAFQKVKLKDLAIFCRQFATMINAGVPLVRCLAVLEEQSANFKLKQIIHDLRREVEGGASLSAAMSKYPRVFSSLFTGLVRAGEVGGVLDETLERMAGFLEKDLEIRRKIKSAMTYPVIVFVFAIAITVFLMTFIVPKFIALFKELGVKELPLPTVVLMKVSEFLTTPKLVGPAIGGLIVLGLLFSFYIKTKPGRRQWDWFKMKIPVVGPIAHKLALSRFARTLATMIQSGVPYLQAMETTAGTLGNEILAEKLMDARAAVREGAPLSTPLSTSKWFPPMVVQMIAVGEETGTLDSMLHKVADFYDSEVDAALASLADAIQPILIVLLGGIVLFILIGVWGPILKIITALSEGG
ncbi:MAG TPA: type II secretion system F family protein [Armatimonadetes bacterium]|nr:type II secretion system F family protein [Armatimonadota bacterium]